MSHKPYPVTAFSDDREMLCIRMRAYAYENVRIGNADHADNMAGYALERFDDMIANNPTNAVGYWAGYYFERFKEDCERFDRKLVL